MNTYAKLLAVALLVTAIGLQTGCDQNDALTVSDTPAALGKGSGNGLGDKLAGDADFKALYRILHDADKQARLKYRVKANVKRDLAFARAAERKPALSQSDKSRLAEIRGLNLDDLKKVVGLRAAIIRKFPEIELLTRTELQDVLRAAGIGQTSVLSKTFDQCDNCNYAYNSCVTNAEMRHAIELMTCALLIETFVGATVCYLGSASKYMWTISSCRSIWQYCLSNYGCLNTAGTDTA